MSKTLLFKSCQRVPLFCISLGLLGSIVALPVRAQSDSVFQAIQANSFTPPQTGAPGGTSGGASRGDGVCASGSVAEGTSVKLLIASSAQNLTTRAHPTYFAHISGNSATQLFLSLQKESGESHYQTIIPITPGSDLIMIQMPGDAPALEIGTSYNWSIALICGTSLRPDDPVITGQVRRVAIDAATLTQLEQMSAVEQAAWYIKHGIWFDALKASMDSQQTVLVKALLNSVGLGDVAAVLASDTSGVR
ncbi:MAG: DUF928 domain-containing protein [Thainema sp.]